MPKVRTMFAVMFAVAVAAVAPRSDAREVREQRAHFILDVPDDWNVDVDGRYVRAATRDGSFRVRLVATDHGRQDERDAEQYLLGILNERFSNAVVDRHAKRVDWNNYEGFEVWGHGTEESGQPGKFFSIFFVDRNSRGRGLVVLGTGTNDGFDRHHDSIYRAVHSIRTW